MIKLRKAKAGDEKGITKVFREGLKRKNWIYNGTNEIQKNNEELLRKRFKEEYFLIALDRKKIIGSVSASPNKGRIRPRVDLGWGVHPDYQNQGIGTKLVKELLRYVKKKRFKKAEAEIAVENIASIKIAKSLGFSVEGRKKKAFLTDDKRYIDTFIVGKWL